MAAQLFISSAKPQVLEPVARGLEQIYAPTLGFQLFDFPEV
jgi:hypothetical protein